jgi:hypothetical protein
MSSIGRESMDSLFSDKNILLSSYQGAVGDKVSHVRRLKCFANKRWDGVRAIPKIGNVAEGHHGLALVTLPAFLLI